MVMSDHAVHYRLPGDAQSVSRARRIMSRLLPDDDRDLRDTAMLLVSELVGNAVRYGEEPITLDVSYGDDTVTIGVSDSGAQIPQLPAVAPRRANHDDDDVDDVSDSEAVGGRGLRLIDTLADAWDIERREAGKRVWFELRPRNRSR